MTSLECGAFPPLLFLLLTDPKQKRRENAALQMSASATLDVGVVPISFSGCFHCRFGSHTPKPRLEAALVGCHAFPIATSTSISVELQFHKYLLPHWAQSIAKPPVRGMMDPGE
jgi:hypothetical protein